MTRSDDSHADDSQGAGNPFDTGLPMLRTPARPHAHPQPKRRRTRRSEDWERWLDEPAPATELPPAPPRPDRMRDNDIQPGPPDDTGVLIPAIIDRSGTNPGTAVRRPRRQAEEPRGGKLLGAAIGVVIAIALVSAGLFVFGGPSERAAVATPTTGPLGAAERTSAPVQSDIATPGCEQRHTPDVVSGTDPGGTGDGPSAILAFERAYYVQRSGYAAREVVAANSTVPPAVQIQRGIDKVPAGTRYCVRITRTEGGDVAEAKWKVELTQQHPGAAPQTFIQLVTTRTAANRTLITAIATG
ncbi:hypothetical protein [Nocardia sp. NPDC052566]|uniref:hypothetical protein n=1 Tax=Nocardia sp. NPDC052566 TaxID=3364330 RepID=UPI0037C5FF66